MQVGWSSRKEGYFLPVSLLISEEDFLGATPSLPAESPSSARGVSQAHHYTHHWAGDYEDWPKLMSTHSWVGLELISPSRIGGKVST